MDKRPNSQKVETLKIPTNPDKNPDKLSSPSISGKTSEKIVGIGTCLSTLTFDLFVLAMIS